jgi:hypothetical protein
MKHTMWRLREQMEELIARGKIKSPVWSDEYKQAMEELTKTGAISAPLLDRLKAITDHISVPERDEDGKVILDKDGKPKWKTIYDIRGTWEEKERQYQRWIQQGLPIACNIHDASKKRRVKMSEKNQGNEDRWEKEMIDDWIEIERKQREKLPTKPEGKIREYLLDRVDEECKNRSLPKKQTVSCETKFKIAQAVDFNPPEFSQFKARERTYQRISKLLSDLGYSKKKSHEE